MRDERGKRQGRIRTWKMVLQQQLLEAVWEKTKEDAKGTDRTWLLRTLK